MKYIYFLSHHGIKGQHWGLRRYQNEDGTLTEEGKRHYYQANGKLTGEGASEYAAKKQKDIYNEYTETQNKWLAANKQYKQAKNETEKKSIKDDIRGYEMIMLGNRAAMNTMAKLSDANVNKLHTSKFTEKEIDAAIVQISGMTILSASTMDDATRQRKLMRQ